MNESFMDFLFLALTRYPKVDFLGGVNDSEGSLQRRAQSDILHRTSKWCDAIVYVKFACKISGETVILAYRFR
jgi:hypothetical protein